MISSSGTEEKQMNKYAWKARIAAFAIFAVAADVPGATRLGA
jgi:hypothetical protein